MMKKILVLAACLAAGCELMDSTSVDSGGGGGDGDWSKIQWQGPSAAGAVQVMTLSASISGGQVHFSWDQYPWGGQAGLCHFFVWTGSSWKGGKFDWIRAGGQGAKGLENIRGGYGGLSAPASGSQVAFAWTSADGRERSNLAKTVWP